MLDCAQRAPGTSSRRRGPPASLQPGLGVQRKKRRREEELNILHRRGVTTRSVNRQTQAHVSYYSKMLLPDENFCRYWILWECGRVSLQVRTICPGPDRDKDRPGRGEASLPYRVIMLLLRRPYNEYYQTFIHFRLSSLEAESMFSL